jgi:hypothetical protein
MLFFARLEMMKAIEESERLLESENPAQKSHQIEPARELKPLQTGRRFLYNFGHGTPTDAL